jgi:CHAT domain-containing protein
MILPEAISHLKRLKKMGRFADANRWATVLPSEIRLQPRFVLEHYRLLVIQGDYVEAERVLASADLSDATSGDRLIFSLESACLNLLRYVTVAHSLHQAKTSFDNRKPTINAADLAEAERVYIRIIAQADVYREVDPSVAQEAYTRLPLLALRLEQTGQHDEAFAAKLTYAQRLSELPERLAEFDRVIREALAEGRPEFAGETLVLKAELLLTSGQAISAIETTLNEAEKQYEQANHTYGVIDVQRVRATVRIQRELADPDLLLPSLAAYKAINQYNGMAKVLMDRSQLAHERGQTAQAVHYRQELYKLFEQTGMGIALDSFRTAQVDLLMRTGNYGGAIELAQAALAEDLPRYTKAGYEIMLGSSYSFIQNYRAACRHSRRALELYTEVKMLDSASDAAFKLANDLSALRQETAWQEADELITTWLTYDKARNNLAASINKLEMRAQICLARYNYGGHERGSPLLLTQAATALDEADDLLASLRLLESLNRQGSLYQLRAQIHQCRDDWEQVIATYQKAVSCYEKAGNLMNAANCQYLAGVLYLNQANLSLEPFFAQSETNLTAALTYYDNASIRKQAADTVFMLARLYTNAALRLDQPLAGQLVDAALAHLSFAEENVDAMRREFTAGDTIVDVQTAKAALVKESTRIYDLALELICFHQQNATLAWQWVQRAKARGLIDMLGINLRIPERLLEQLKDAPGSLKQIELERDLTQQLNQASPGLKVELRQRLQQHWEQMTLDSHLTDYLKLRQGKSLTLGDVGEWWGITQTDQNCVFVDWFSINDRLLLLTLRPNETPQITLLPIRSSTVRQFIQANLSPETLRTTLRNVPELLRELDTLIAPLAWLTNPSELLIFSPTQTLFAVPLHALELTNEPLLVRNPVVYVPSLSTLRYCLGEPKPTTTKPITAIIGDPNQNLAEAAMLVAHLGTQFGTTPLVGAAVTRDAFLKAITEAELIHFQGHAVHVPGQPLQSHLQLADGLFTAEELIKMPSLRAKFVTLAACESATSQIAAGDEPMGLIPAFLYAKTQSIIATLWKVNQTSAAQLMRQFYDRLPNSSGRIHRAEALRQAALWVRTQPGYESPYHWAPFVLYGDWQ